MSLSFQPEMFNRITAYCAERGCSKSWFMSKAAELFLNECLEEITKSEGSTSSVNEAGEAGEGQ